jgi:hypothetical protein
MRHVKPEGNAGPRMAAAVHEFLAMTHGFPGWHARFGTEGAEISKGAEKADDGSVRG